MSGADEDQVARGQGGLHAEILLFETFPACWPSPSFKAEALKLSLSRGERGELL